MSVGEDSERILKIIYENQGDKPSSQELSKELGFNKAHTEDCIDYLEERQLVETARGIGRHYESISLTANGIDRVEQKNAAGESGEAQLNQIQEINADTVNLQTNIGSDNATQRSSREETQTNVSIETQPGLVHLLAPLYKWLTDNLSTQQTLTVTVLSILVGLGGSYEYIETQFIPQSGGLRLAIGVMSLFLVLFGIGYYAGRIWNRCEECDTLFTFKPTGEAEITDREQRDNLPDLVTIEDLWECSACGYTETRNRTQPENEI